MSRTRNDNIDLLRVISCILVVCIHVSNIYSRGFGEVSNGTYLCSLVVNACSRVSVPVFFMISGYLLLEEPISLRKCLHRVGYTIVVLAAWSLVYYIWDLIYWGRGYDFRLIFDEPVKKHLWFLYAIVGMYIALPFFQCLFQKMTKRMMEYFMVLWMFFLLLYFVLALLDMDFSYMVPMVGNSSYLGYFVMGYLLRQFAREEDKKRFSCRFCMLSALAVALVNVGITCGSSVAKGEHVEIYFQYRNPLIALSALFFFYGIAMSAHIVYTQRQKALMRCISKCSFTIYLSHILMLDVVKKEMSPLSLPGWLGILLFTVMIFLTAWGFAALGDRIWRRASVIKSNVANMKSGR